MGNGQCVFMPLFQLQFTYISLNKQTNKQKKQLAEITKLYLFLGLKML